MRKTILWAFVLPLLLISCGKKEQSSTNIIKVKTQVVGASSFSTDGSSYSGTIEESSGSSLSFATSGTVKALYVSEGQSVRAGQVIGIVDATTSGNALTMAELLVPFMQFYFIRKPITTELPKGGKKKFSFLDLMQKYYNKLIDACFRHPYITVASGVVIIVLGVFLLGQQPVKMMPTADRNQFAVEIYLPTGTSLDRTAEVADSMEHILRRDPRVVSVASFKGTSSPRFQFSYAPQFGGKNYAQFIVNTKSEKATIGVLKDYRMRYTNAFPRAYVRFKQLSYSDEANAVELRLSGSDWQQLKHTADSITALFRADKDLILARNDVGEPQLVDDIKLNEQRAGRLGVTNGLVELTMATRYGNGIPVTTIWDGDYGTQVCLKSTKADRSMPADIANEPIPVMGGLRTVPLRQVATIKPVWQDGQICHRNGVRTITVMADVVDGVNVVGKTKALQAKILTDKLPKGIKAEWGGELETGNETNGQVQGGLMISVVIIFFLMLAHFRKISTATLLLVSLSMVMFGTAMGILIPGGNFSLTCNLGIISLMGILVRNAIIMYDYAEELREKEHLTAHQAIQQSAKRRMRPIFLTSAAASMGVVPMMLGGSSLWAPMGNVIFYGTLITMVLILTVLPVAYWLVMSGSTHKRELSNKLELQ